MADPIDFNKMEKLPPGCRFFDVNELWYFPNRLGDTPVVPVADFRQCDHTHGYGHGLDRCRVLSVEYRIGIGLGCVIPVRQSLFLDNVDGGLARLRGEESRFGRFLDSSSDFAVSVLVYGAVTFRLIAQHSSNPGFIWMLGVLALVSSLLQCSYWVYYYVSYTDWVGSYAKNRTDETITAADRDRGGIGRIVRHCIISATVSWDCLRLAGCADRSARPNQPRRSGL